MPPIHEWRTPRLLIRRFREDDLQGLYELHADPEATRFIGGVWSRERAEKTLPLIIGNYQAKELEWFAVTLEQAGTFLGACWLGPMSPRWCDVLGIGPQIELGYRYDRRYWGNGYATEAGRAMLRRGFTELGLPEIASIVRPDNVASDRVLNKLGMQYRKSGTRDDGVTARYYTLSREAFLAGNPA